MTILQEFRHRSTVIRYLTNADQTELGLQILPVSKLADEVPHRPNYVGVHELEVLPWGGTETRVPNKIDPLVHVKLVGEEYPFYYAHGATLKFAPALKAMRFTAPVFTKEGDRSTVTTHFTHPRGWALEHKLYWFDDEDALHVACAFINNSLEALQLESLTSFNLTGVTPFAEDEAPDALFMHRFRTSWAQEARHECRSLDEIHLETGWGGDTVLCERFGSNGSMPTKEFFPFVAVEDRPAGVFWGAQVAWAGSWQMELLRRDDWIGISGGLADREKGHWIKTVQPGERIDAPEAVIASVAGSIDDLCHVLTRAQDRVLKNVPAIEQDMPIAFNDWCAAWGNPTKEFINQVVTKLKGAPVTYITIDAGWFNPMTEGDFSMSHGDWEVASDRFPNGLKDIADSIRAAGFIPGLWFEIETCGRESKMFKNTEHLLKRDGVPLTATNRRFLDLSDPWVKQYLQERVIERLANDGFGYLKIDYNESIGIGVDHPDSLGEGVRKNVLGWYEFLASMKKQIPDLVVENCSSGGHRLEPSLMARCEMASFSDAHETTNMPIIAAQLQRLILPRQSQIWAVLHPADNDDRFVYSLTTTFYGRMCISGEVIQLTDAQMALVKRSMAFYKNAAPTIKYGKSTIKDSGIGNRRHTTGWQSVLRVRDDGQQALITAHAFNIPAAQSISVALPDGTWKISDSYHTDAVSVAVQGTTATLTFTRPYNGVGVLLERIS